MHFLGTVSQSVSLQCVLCLLAAIVAVVAVVVVSPTPHYICVALVS